MLSWWKKLLNLVFGS